MYAIVENSGRQYKVQEGQILNVEKLEADVGSEVVLDSVLLVHGEDGVNVGSPYVPGKVACEVVEHGREKKVVVFKHKKRKDYRRKAGHRQWYTRLKVKGIEI
ncbi:MAG: 50S ribosomal protein L21 [Desulfohalobiaceae bacterium]|nr:50S ribosomal protein L21 [Desulfohalobiaceae bacterium]